MIDLHFSLNDSGHGKITIHTGMYNPQIAFAFDKDVPIGDMVLHLTQQLTKQVLLKYNL